MNKYQEWISKRYLAYRVLTSMWFLSAVWLYLYRIYITDYQVGILDAVAFAIGLVAEVPSGALADRFGRAKLIKIGQVLVGGGILIQAFGNSFLPFFIGQAILMVGLAFMSGADDALFFEKLKYKKDSLDWRKLVTRGSQLSLLFGLLATVVGGFLHTIDPRIPWVLTGLAFVLSVLTISKINDDRRLHDFYGFKNELKGYLEGIKLSVKEFWSDRLRLYLPIIFVVQGLFYASGFGILRIIMLDRFEFEPFWGSLVIASSSLITVGLLGYMHKNAHAMSEKKVISITAISAASSLLLSVANIGNWGYIVILVLYAGEYLITPFMSDVLNKHTSDSHRATVLSTASFLKSIPYVLLAPVIGYLNTQNSLESFFVIWAALIIASVAIYLRLRKRDFKIEV